MDKIIIEALKVDTVIGAYAWEQQIKQSITLDLELGFNSCAAAQSDELSDTLDYHSLCEQLKQFVTEHRCQLIEHLAQNIINFLQQKFSLPWIKLTVKKRPAGLSQVASIAISMERSLAS